MYGQVYRSMNANHKIKERKSSAQEIFYEIQTYIVYRLYPNTTNKGNIIINPK